MLNLSMIDMERVEVVKGPQNALYGRNAFAGALNYVTKKPGDELDASVTGTVGTDERYDVQVSVGGPLTPNKMLRGKFTYGYTEYDGHTGNNHPFAGANPPGAEHPGQPGRLGRRSVQRHADFRTGGKPVPGREFLQGRTVSRNTTRLRDFRVGVATLQPAQHQRPEL